ncbi:MAG: hypothetical protein GY841_04490 [FCB group bacterium]|nr:hypothetical protein [FCB group bacterium]
MPQDEIHVSDIGTVILATIYDAGAVVDISSVLAKKEFIFLKPDDTTTSQNTVFTTDGSDGKMQYTAVDGFWDSAGKWKVQARLSDATTEFHSTIAEFVVYGNII